VIPTTPAAPPIPLATCWYSSEDPEDAEEFASAKHVLDEICTEYKA